MACSILHDFSYASLGDGTTMTRNAILERTADDLLSSSLTTSNVVAGFVMP
jgi:hypothetical protein